MKKRIISSVICVLLAFTVLSGSAWGYREVVSIAGQDVTQGYWKNNADNSGVEEAADQSSANAYFQGDPDTEGTLYLNGLNVTTSDASSMRGYGIVSTIPLTIDLTGTNSITTADGSKTDTVALLVNGDLTVTGDGSLTANAGDVEDSNSTGVLVTGKLTQESGTLTGNGGAASLGDPNHGGAPKKSFGIEAGEIEVTGGSLTGTGGETPDSGGTSTGIYVHGVAVSAETITVSGGTLTGNGGNAYDYSYGISSQGAISASGSGEIAGTAGNAQNAGVGIECYDTLTASDNAKISGTGGNAMGEEGTSCGIYAGSTITVSDCATIDAVGDSAKKASYGIYWEPMTDEKINSPIKVRGGLLTATGGRSDNDSYGINLGKKAVSFSDGVIIAKSSGGSNGNSAFFYSYLIMPSSFYWRTSPTAAFSHYPEDGIANASAVTYLELRTKLPPAPPAATPTVETAFYTVEKTDEGFVVKGEFNAFYGVWVDGEEVDEDNYTVETTEDGGILVKLDEDYRKTLSKGEHILRINLTNGYGEVKFTVE